MSRFEKMNNEICQALKLKRREPKNRKMKREPLSRYLFRPLEQRPSPAARAQILQPPAAVRFPEKMMAATPTPTPTTRRASTRGRRVARFFFPSPNQALPQILLGKKKLCVWRRRDFELLRASCMYNDVQKRRAVDSLSFLFKREIAEWLFWSKRRWTLGCLRR